MKSLFFAILLSTISLNALGFIGGYESDATGCPKGADPGECARGVLMAFSSLPTLILAADGSAQMNPQLVDAVNTVLSSKTATKGQKEQAKSVLQKMANDLAAAQ